MLSRMDDTEIALQIKLPVATFIINSDFISLMLSSSQDSAHPKILFKEKQLN